MKTLIPLLVLSTTVFAQVSKTTTQVTVTACSGSGTAMIDVDVYKPAGAGPFALIGIAHGFQLSKEGMANLANDLATQGAVVVVPQFPLLLRFEGCSSDHSRNADILWAAMQQQASLPSVNSSWNAVVGHSAGGLSAWLAASRHAVMASVLLDPVDNSSLGLNASATVQGESLFVFAPPSTCNSSGNATAWFAPKTGFKARLRVVGANHCDAQSPTTGTCTAACGGTGATSVQRQTLFRNWTVAFLDVQLHQATRCLATEAATQATAGTIDEVDFQLVPCVQPVDAGTPFDAGSLFDAGQPVVDAGSIVDAGVTLDAGTTFDAGTDVDAGSEMPVDAGHQEERDAGNMTADAGTIDSVPTTGCGCSSAIDLTFVGVLFFFRCRRSGHRTAVPS